MPILTLQQSMRRLGRIRMGAKGQTKKGNRTVEFPKKLETWRMTSMSKELLEAASALYGGEVGEWEGSPNGKQWELFTEADAIDVIIPPGDMAFSQWFEMWSGGGCQRRCDGETEQLSDSPCMCPFDPEERIAAAQKGQACKPTTRLFVIQPHLPDVGLWHFESHGFYAATEIPGTINIIRTAAVNGALIPARLRIEQRTSKTGTETLKYAVPVIELPTLTPHTLMSGEIVRGELPSGEPAQLAAPALGAGVPDQAPGGEAKAEPVGDVVSTPQEPPAKPVVQKDPQRLHKYLGSMGFSKDDQAAMILCASAGRSSHASDLTQSELSAAEMIGENVRDGKRTLEEVHQAVANAAKATAEGAARPLPAAGTGDGANMRRSILSKAKRLGLDGDALDAVCRGRVGKTFAELTDFKDANDVMAALDGQQQVLV